MGGGGGSSMDYVNIQRMWGMQEASPTSINNEPDINPGQNNDFGRAMNIGQSIGPTVQVEVQPNILIRNYQGIMKPVELPYDNRRLSNGSSKITGRRVSNGSVDSSYQSGTETYNGSRRGSDMSTTSFNSCGSRSGRLSARNLASPLLSRNIKSPNLITQTVTEGQVLDDYPTSNTPPKNSMGDQQTGQQNFRSSSSGYGSQNLYFPSKNQRASPIPPFKGEIRRASEGTVRRLSDSHPINTTASHLNKQRVLNRRGSEPVQTSHIIDNTPRRHSLSVFNPLPLAPSMQHHITDETQINLRE